MGSQSLDPTASFNTGGLELRIAARGSNAVLTLHNDGPDQLTVFSYVQGSLEQYDWFTIFIAGPAETCTLHLYDDRNASARVTANLAPGQEVEHVIDVVAWAQRKPNGARPLAPGTYRMWASYEVTEPGDVWTGKLVSPTVAITIP
ncbi:MAG: hypothetical protein QOJ88_1030 [Pyrinomonadaceae bacterium]|jgi:hypothetical protein|nr:hypothetical protein [Pyrinomonadaceae bacterium]MDQ1728837.1 hypothetical protein [Pyrinomonadaceae bacterium]